MMQIWQQELFDKITSGVRESGEIILMTAGRRVGKSQITQQAIDRLLREINSRPLEELVLGESRFRGARFYTVEPVGGNWQEMQEWAKKTFGPASDPWDFKMDSVGRWYVNDRRFWFRNERDRTMFILRWR